MKRPIKIIYVILVIVAAGIIVLNLLVNLFGKKILVDQIKENLGMPASVNGMSVGLPLSLDISGLQIGDLARIKRISLSPSLLGFLAGKIVLNRLVVVDPVISVVQSENGALNLPQLKQGGKQPPLLLAGLVIKNGTVMFNDQKTSPALETTLRDINLNISKISLPPTSLFTRYRLSAEIADPKGKKLGEISGNGWIDFGPKDMDGNFQLLDVEATYFAPYCGSLFGDLLINKNLTSAKLNFNADLKAKSDDLKIACRLGLSDFVYNKEQSQQETEDLSSALPNLLNVFLGKEGKMDLNFNIDTKLSQPNFNILQIASGAVKKNITDQPPEKTAEKVSNAIEQFKVIGKNLKNIWKDKSE